MKTNELRIGNKVLNDNVENTIIGILQENINIVNLKTQQGNIINANINLIKPIELTEEWLIKFRFRYLRETERWVIGKLKAPRYKYELELFIFEGKFYFNDLFREIKYVHILQNVYYFNLLTGKELEI